MLAIDTNSKIYILTPTKRVTGGVEALHTLTHYLRILGYNARIVYTPNVAHPTPRAYQQYNIEHTKTIEDHAKNLLIVPEVMTERLNAFHQIQKAIWWLSVDYHLSHQQKFSFFSPENNAVVHLAQSHYADQFLRQNGARWIYPLTSPLNKIFYKTYPPLKRKDTILYNPLKGKEITQALINTAPHLSWVPLTEMNRTELIRMMHQSKLYIDFGPHPGRDRLPREAAINGCCIIVAKNGAAALQADFPIPERYKYETKNLDIPAIIAGIHDCLDNYEQRIADFKEYRQFVSGEKERFLMNMARIFGSGHSTRRKILNHLQRKVLPELSFKEAVREIIPEPLLPLARGLRNRFVTKE